MIGEQFKYLSGGYKTIDDFNTQIKSIVENKDNIKLEADTISLKT